MEVTENNTSGQSVILYWRYTPRTDMAEPVNKYNPEGKVFTFLEIGITMEVTENNTSGQSVILYWRYTPRTDMAEPVQFR